MSEREAAPRICIAAPRMGLWSETFIAAHVRNLSGVELVLTDGVLPSRVHEGPLLLRRSGTGRLFDHAEARVRRTGIDGLLRSRISSMLRKHHIDVVLAEYGTCADAIAEPCAEAGIPLVAHFHGFDAHNTSFVRDTGGYKRLFKNAHTLVVVSRSMEQQLLDLGAPREKVVYSSYGIDVDRFVAGHADLAPAHFLAVGRFVEKKAPQLTLSAFELASQQVPDARLTMVGHGPLWESCAQRLRSGILSGKVDLVGIKGHEEVAAMMRKARAFVQHSVEALSGDREGTPLAVLEAMASALPVIATRHAGIADVVVHEEHGLLCDEFDIQAMANHMVRLAKDPAMAARMGAGGRMNAERSFRVEHSIARLQLILAGAAERAVR